MKKDNWGKVRSTKTGRIDKRTNLAKAFRSQGEKLIDKKSTIVYNTKKKEEVSGEKQTS